MCSSHARPPRVLLGNFEPMLLLGMSRVLGDSGVVVAQELRPAEVPAAAAAMEPDAIVLPLDGGSAEVGRRARASAPAAKLILWARDESEMHVYDPGRTVPRRVFTVTQDALLHELDHEQRRRGGQ